MDSLDAQCLAFDLTSAGGEAPDQWQHFADGSLAYRFGESPNTFSWPADKVTDMATRWRASGRDVPHAIATLVEGHRRFTDILESAALASPDRVIHDLRSDELLAFWDDEKRLVIVGPE